MVGERRMRRVIIESPFAGQGDTPEQRAANTERNKRYLQACMRDSLLRGESPFASHGLYTQPGVLDDTDPDERKHGIEASFAWREVAHATIVYDDLGLSHGMLMGIEAAKALRERGSLLVVIHELEYRQLGGKWAAS